MMGLRKTRYLNDEESERDAHTAMKSLIKDVDDNLGQYGFQMSAQTRNVPEHQELCATCNREIIGKYISALNKKFHPHCFVCSQCDRTIELKYNDTFTVRKDQPWCSKCIAFTENEQKLLHTGSAAKVSGINTTSTSTTTYIHPSGKSATTTTFSSSIASSAPSYDAGGFADVQQIKKRLESGKCVCCCCGEAVAGWGYDIFGEFYHVQCFTCSHCGNDLDPNGGVKRNSHGQFFHSHCVNSGSVCFACKQTLEGKFVIFQDQKYHKDCLNCSCCRGSLSNGYALRDGKPHCASCIQKNAKPAISVSTGGVISGIRFDQKNFTTSTVPMKATPSATLASSTVATKPATPASSAAAKKKFCTECGTQAEANEARFCGECGTPL